MAVEIGHRLQKNDRIIVYQPDNHHSFKSGTLKGYVYEHIYNAECKLGRELLDGEVVHHLDQDKVNNNPDNLLVFRNAHDHSVFHMASLHIEDLEKLDNGSYKVPDTMFKYTVARGKGRLVKTFVCEYCGKQFEAKIENHRAAHVYCNIQCTNKARRKQVPATGEQLLQEVKQLHTFKHVGDKYGVKAAVIRKRIEEAGLLEEASKYIRYH